jgi:Na+-transporting NADH:ubiquinone oxidoreductase subunit NqrD
MQMMPRRSSRKMWEGHHAPNTHYVNTATAMAVVGTTTAIVVTNAMITVTTKTTVIGGGTTATPLEASVLVRMIMKSMRLRSQVVTVITRMTTARP